MPLDLKSLSAPYHSGTFRLSYNLLLSPHELDSVRLLASYVAGHKIAHQTVYLPGRTFWRFGASYHKAYPLSIL